MAIAHPHLSKRTRWLFERTRGYFKSVRLAGIALGCGIALDIGAAAGAPTSANARVPAALNVGCGRNGVALQVLGSGESRRRLPVISVTSSIPMRPAHTWDTARRPVTSFEKRDVSHRAFTADTYTARP